MMVNLIWICGASERGTPGCRRVKSLHFIHCNHSFRSHHILHMVQTHSPLCAALGRRWLREDRLLTSESDVKVDH